MPESWIVAGVRTPIGRFLGDLAPLTAPELGGIAIAEAVRRLPLDTKLVDEVAMGQVLSAGAGQAPARQAARLGGLPDSVGCVTINKVCGSGLYAVMLADRSIRSGDCNVVVAGGMESMSQAPHLIRNARQGWKYGVQKVDDAIEFDGLRCAHGIVMMGSYADQVASSFGIDRRSQDEWALESHSRAVAAQGSGKFDAEIAAVTMADGVLIAKDGGPRGDTNLERLSKLKPAFSPDGTVTAGNSSTLSDGAAAVVVVNETLRAELAQPTSFRILGIQVHAAQPKDLFVAPVGAIQKLLASTRKTLEEVDCFEINEAFASQTLACRNALKIESNKLNVHGGALALGHPIGCSGARVLVTLMHSLKTYQKSIGVAALCLGGGEAVAIMIEMHSGS